MREIKTTYQVWTGEGFKLITTSDEVEARQVCRKARAAGMYAKVHTHREWPCGECGTTVHASSHDADCEKCGACYTVYGQRLNRNWRSNRSLYDEDCSDLDGYENALAGDS
jgi:hypothetical protein